MTMARAEAERLAESVPRESYYAGRWTAARDATAFEAVAIANDCDYALAATVWTSDISRAHTVARKIRAGAVAVNGWSPLDPALSWGGSRLSGHGRDLGWSGIEASTEEKTVTVVL